MKDLPDLEDSTRRRRKKHPEPTPGVLAPASTFRNHTLKGAPFSNTKPSRSLLMRPRALGFGEGVGLIPGRAREGRQTEQRIIGGAERGKRQPIAPIIEFETQHFNLSAISLFAEGQLRNHPPSPGEGV